MFVMPAICLVDKAVGYVSTRGGTGVPRDLHYLPSPKSVVFGHGVGEFDAWKLFRFELVSL